MIYVELSDKAGQKEIELYGIFTISEVLDMIASEADYETDDESCSDEESEMDTDEEMEAAREEARLLHLDLD